MRFKINDKTSNFDTEILFSTLERYFVDKFKLNSDNDFRINNDLLVLVSEFSSVYA